MKEKKNSLKKWMLFYMMMTKRMKIKENKRIVYKIDLYTILLL